ncbi:MAG: 4'-phosphopantetheinyl transferase superfamily protein [Deltaproteobacteria bacterium]|nr:4'-phosphopantetheinyl transferase superfamily protein [Deltaproteobacteria bacterium]
MIALPAGCELAEVALGPGDDRHACGQRAAALALAPFGATLSYDGTRPIANGVAISITHGRTRALAIAGHVARLGIDLVDDEDETRLARLAPRFLAAERELATTAASRAACFAAKEAGLKALGLGLYDGGMFDDCAVTVLSLDPPRLAPDLALVVGRVADGTVAIAFAI